MNLAKQTAMVLVGFAAIAVIIASSMILLDRHWNRGYCVPTGDLLHSDHMKVLTNFSGLNRGEVLGKDGKKYNIIFCPSMEVNIGPGDEITEARYEYRHGCWDFSNDNAVLQINGRN